MLDLNPSATVVASFEKPKPYDEEKDDTMEFDYHYVFECIRNVDRSVIASSISDNTIKTFSYPNLEHIGKIEAHSDTITRIRFSRSQPYELFSSSLDSTIKGWDTRTFSEGLTFHTVDEVYDFDLGYDDTLIAAGLQEKIKFFDIRSNRQLGEYSESHSDAVTQVQFNPSTPSIIVTGSEDGLICLYNTSVSSEDEALVSVMNADCAIRKIGFFGADNPGLYCLTGVETMSLWHWGTAQRIVDFGDVRSLLQNKGVQVDYLVDCHFFPETDELNLLAGTQHGIGYNIMVLPNSLEPKSRLQGGHKEGIRCFAWGDKTQLFTGGEDARLCFWNFSQGEETENGNASDEISSSYGPDRSKDKMKQRSFKPY